MNIETDLKRLAQLAKEREDENWEFRTWLKSNDDEGIDAIVHRINEEVAAQIDCTTCGNCCAVNYTTVDDDDVRTLAAGLAISPEEVRETYLQVDEEGDDVLRGLPCVFLKDKRCTVYEHRPETCRSFPHLHKDEFTWRLMGVVWNCSICPIVFNVYERLKSELGWLPRSKRRRR